MEYGLHQGQCFIMQPNYTIRDEIPETEAESKLLDGEENSGEACRRRRERGRRVTFPYYFIISLISKKSTELHVPQIG